MLKQISWPQEQEKYHIFISVFRITMTGRVGVTARDKCSTCYKIDNKILIILASDMFSNALLISCNDYKILVNNLGLIVQTTNGHVFFYHS